jgi:hypothetical protein
MDTYFRNEPVTEAEKAIEEVSNILDTIFNVFFLIECSLKIISYGFILGEYTYIRDSWNQMDFIIVLSSIIDMSVTTVDL